MTKIVAECGVNWRTKEEAFEMIKQCKVCGLSHAKFQIFNEETIKDSPLKKELTPLILTIVDIQELYEYGKEIGQSVFFTPMFLEAVYWLEEIGATEIIKIRYSDRYEYPLIEKALKTAKRVIMSVDKRYRMSPDLTLNILKIDFLLCVPKYPAADKDYNFKCMDFDFFAGISDHTKGLDVAKRMLKCRGQLLEKHVMLPGTHPIEEKWSVTFEKLGELNPHNHYPISPEKNEDGEGEKGEKKKLERRIFKRANV